MADATAICMASSVTKTATPWRQSVSVSITQWVRAASNASLCITIGHGWLGLLFLSQRGLQMNVRVSST